ncbi:MAG TPA: Gfo/Idh/MocA family oxidoreductase [Methylomirabilota bacterium]|nr:Gfo/Idh/MocA family oxidoreductase [Methylomirabilota bacterium]
MTPTPTVGVVGLGFGRAHVPAFQAAGARVVAVCQRDVDTARTVAAAYGVPHAFARWQEMLATARPDVVVIATPPHLHREIAAASAAAGAHVLCEKPLATTRADAEAIVADVARAGRVGMTGFNWRFPAAMQRLRALVADGALGRVLHVQGRWLGARWADEASAPTWRMDRAQAGHGAMGDMGVHLVDLVRWTCGDFARVTAHAGIAYPGRAVPGSGRVTDAEDYMSVLGELASGAEVSFVASRAAHGRNEHTLEIYGTRGALAYRLTRDTPRWYAGELAVASGGGGFTPVTVDAPAVDATDPMDVIGRAMIAPLAARLLAAIGGGASPEPSLADGLRAQLVLEAAREATARRAWVDVT